MYIFIEYLNKKIANECCVADISKLPQGGYRLRTKVLNYRAEIIVPEDTDLSSFPVIDDLTQQLVSNLKEQAGVVY